MFLHDFKYSAGLGSYGLSYGDVSRQKKLLVLLFSYSYPRRILNHNHLDDCDCNANTATANTFLLNMWHLSQFILGHTCDIYMEAIRNLLQFSHKNKSGCQHTFQLVIITKSNFQNEDHKICSTHSRCKSAPILF